MGKKLALSITLGIPGLLLGVVLFLFVLVPLFGPFNSVSVPASCTDRVSHLTSLPGYSLPGVGTGTVLIRNANAAVVVVSDYGKSPFYTHVYVLNRSTGQVANYFDFPTNVVDAGFDGDTLYLFNDKLGHFVNARSGKSINDSVTSDNYRGLYQADRVQTDLTISGMTANHAVFFRHHIQMVNIVHGCYLR